MHICLVGIEFPPDTDSGGISTYQKRLADSLISLGNKVTVICGTDKKARDYYEDDVHIIRLYTSRTLETTKTLKKYRELVKKTIIDINNKEKIDIVETPEFSGEIVEFLKDRNIPVVVKCHTSYKIWAMLNNVTSNSLSKKIKLYENLSMEYADKLICCSQILKDLIPLYHKNIDVKNIEVIPNPANVTDFYPLNDNHQSDTILYCGSFENRKGIYQLAKAIPLIYDKLNNKNIKFQIVGKYLNETKNKFLKEIPEKYHRNIEFLGHIENKELNKYYNNARIGVIPSLFDNLPYVAMEELLTELPIVASENTGIREMIKNEESGILYDPNDYQALANGVIKLYNNSELARKCGKQGRKEIIEKYSPEVIAKKNIQIYNHTIVEFNNKLILRKVCKKYNLKILGKLKKGNANLVRKCLYNNKKCILKIYHPSKEYNFDLIKDILKNNENFLKIIFIDKYLDYNIYLYSYINGKHKHINSLEQINKLFKILDSFKYIKLNNNLDKYNIFTKYNKYKNYLLSSNESDFYEIIKSVMFYDNRYVSKINSNNCCIVHGDLSYENILWKNNIPYLIDFDECCFAPKEYEYANFLIKNCFIKNKFNVTLAKKIIKAAKYNNVDILNLKYNFYLYIIKVIIEKIYYHLLLGLDLESEEQKKDYWKWWYYLLLNDKTIDSIFIDN